MNTQNLVKMANDIARFFEHGAMLGNAENDIAGHMKRFWDPRMRKQIVVYVDEEYGAGLRPSALRAIQKNRDALCGRATAVRDELKWPEGGGDAG